WCPGKVGIKVSIVWISWIYDGVVLAVIQQIIRSHKYFQPIFEAFVYLGIHRYKIFRIRLLLIFYRALLSIGQALFAKPIYRKVKLPAIFGTIAKIGKRPMCWDEVAGRQSINKIIL